MTASINPTRDTVSELAQSAEFRAAERKAYVEWQARNPETEVQP